MPDVPYRIRSTVCSWPKMAKKIHFYSKTLCCCIRSKTVLIDFVYEHRLVDKISSLYLCVVLITRIHDCAHICFAPLNCTRTCCPCLKHNCLRSCRLNHTWRIVQNRVLPGFSSCTPMHCVIHLSKQRKEGGTKNSTPRNKKVSDLLCVCI